MSFYNLISRPYREYIRSDETLRILNIIILSAAIGTFLFTAQGGVAFAGYASALGAREFAFGLISALPVLAGLFQIYASNLVMKTGKYKTMFMTGGVIQRVSWIVVAFIPYFFSVEDSRIWALIVLVTLAAMSGSCVGITHMTLMGSVIPIDIRGRYITTRQKVCTAAGLIFGLCIAFMLDYIPGFLGYTVVFGIGGIAGLIDILMYHNVKFSAIPAKSAGFSLGASIKSCFTTPKVRNYLLFWTFWCFAINLSGPFFNKYAIDVLNLSYLSIIVFGQIVAQTMMILVISRWGVFLDRYGSVPMMLISSIAATVIAFVWMFAAPGILWPLIVFNCLGGIFWCANEACMANMQLSHTPVDGRPAVLAVYAVFTSVATAAALLTSGALLETFSPIMASLELTYLGTPFDHYKLVFCIGIIVRFAVIAIFLPRVWNEKEMHFSEAYIKLRKDIKSRLKYNLSRIRLR
ncbi:MAG: MFS transporter [Oscillospiraceae bacterium]|nr:MFS transporter [Oscillospiraceae bacterium]